MPNMPHRSTSRTEHGVVLPLTRGSPLTMRTWAAERCSPLDTYSNKMKTLVLSILMCLLALPVIAQSKRGMHYTDGTWTAPTTQSALEVTRSGDRNTVYAVAVLRQTFNKHDATELDAFADELVKLFLEGDYAQSAAAASALVLAGTQHGEGTPYTKSPELSMRIYEELRGTDVILAWRALSSAFRANGEVLVRDLFHNSPKPNEACNPSMRVDNKTRCPYNHDPRCAAGHVLAYNSMEDSPLVRPLPTDPTPDDIFPYCNGWVKDGNKWPRIVF